MRKRHRKSKNKAPKRVFGLSRSLTAYVRHQYQTGVNRPKIRFNAYGAASVGYSMDLAKWVTRKYTYIGWVTYMDQPALAAAIHGLRVRSTSPGMEAVGGKPFVIRERPLPVPAPPPEFVNFYAGKTLSLSIDGKTFLVRDYLGGRIHVASSESAVKLRIKERIAPTFKDESSTENDE